MSLRPVIFLSAVSKELKTARQAAANTLTALGYTPVWQDIFGFEAGDLPAMLRRKVDAAKAVIQIVGKCYGAEPVVPTPEFGRVSYTQYEALYAHSKGKPVHYLFTGPDYPADEHDPEPPELAELQSAYLRQIKLANHLRHPAATPAELENKIFRLRDDLTRLRRRTRQWALASLGGILAVAGGVGWIINSQRQHQGTLAVIDQKLDAAAERDKLLLAALRKIPTVVKEPASGVKAPDPIDQAYAVVEAELQQPPGTLKRELPEFTARLLLLSETPPLVRALAYFDRRQMKECAAEASKAFAAANSMSPPDKETAQSAMQLAVSAKIMNKALKADAWNTARTINESIRQFSYEYSRLPAPDEASKGTDLVTDSSSTTGLIPILLGLDKAANPREVSFLGDMRQASEWTRADGSTGHRSGLHLDGKHSSVLDPWGKEYRVLLDLDYDEKISHPDESRKAKGTQLMHKNVFVWSAGPDGDYNTWDDNCTDLTDSTDR